MNEKLICLVVMMLLSVGLLSGCTEETTHVETESFEYDELKILMQQNEINQNKFEKLMFQGMRKNSYGDYYCGNAASAFDDARTNYDYGYMEVAISYYDYADVVFASANDYYKQAESYFSRSIEFAPNDNMEELASLFENEAMYGAMVTSALHQNCEYMSSACLSYYYEDYEIGDEQLETANTFIATHDSLIPPYENATTDIDSLLDLL